MTSTADDHPSAENLEFEHKLANGALSSKLSSNHTLGVLTQKVEDEAATNHEGSENDRKSSQSQVECGKFLERRIANQASTERQDDDRHASNGLLPSKTDACERETVAPDGGWGWMVLGGCVYCTVSMLSFMFFLSNSGSLTYCLK